MLNKVRVAFLSLVLCFNIHSMQLLKKFLPSRFQSQQTGSIEQLKQIEKTKTQEIDEKLPDYTVNLQWINKKLNPEQRYIHPSQNSLALRKNLLMGLYSWALQNPNAKGVVLWYDSQLTPHAAVEKTRRIIARDSLLLGLFKKKAPVLLKDVRELPEVKENPEAFSEKSPIYFRVDLLRAIAAYNVAKKEGKTFVYSDVDMTALKEEELFDASTLNDLRRYGMVMANARGIPYENGFQIVSNYNDKLLKAMKYALIKPNLLNAHNFVPCGTNPNCFEMYNSLHQIVFHSYHTMFKYFFKLENVGKLSYYSEEYSKTKHGLEPFALQQNPAGEPYGFGYGLKLESLKTKKSEDFSIWDNKFRFPTKSVPLPKTEGSYIKEEIELSEKMRKLKQK